MEVITDLRTLNAIARRYGLVFDRAFKYCTGDIGNGAKNQFILMYHNGGTYNLKYFDGCFYPYLVKL